jgi:hypothetical protein
MSAIFFTLFIACSDVDQADDSNKRQVTENRVNFCYPAVSGECYDSTRTNVPIVVSGCTLYVSWDVKKCITASGCRTIHIANMTFTYGSSTACTRLKQSVNGDVLVNGWSSYYANYNVLYRALSNLAEAWEVQRLINFNNVGPCDVFVEWIASGCVTHCISGIDDDGIPELEEIKCGEGCCFRTNWYQNINGVPVGGTPTITPGLPCSPITAECMTGDNYCNPVCDRL